MSCAPRQMPRIGLFDSMRAATAAIFLADERIGVALIDADRTAQHDHQIGRDQRLGVEGLNAGIEIVHVIAARGQQRAEQAEILEGDVAHRQAFFDHGAMPLVDRRQFTRQRIGPLRDRTGAKADAIVGAAHRPIA